MDEDGDIDLADLAGFQNRLTGDGLTQPRIENSSHSGCLRGTRVDSKGNVPYPCEDEAFYFAAEDGRLHIVHENTVHDCCVEDLAATLSIDGNVLSLCERGTTPIPCDCICCFNVETTVVDLAPGAYTVEYCTYWCGEGAECHVEEIMIP
ncbi:MAG: hypothetical protein JSU63_18480 [Phycisphaerales bacterium]|nr:MAG: hypothetical protein JSU63_18480 [Phycisphaerales bacterium]